MCQPYRLVSPGCRLPGKPSWLFQMSLLFHFARRWLSSCPLRVCRSLPWEVCPMDDCSNWYGETWCASYSLSPDRVYWPVSPWAACRNAFCRVPSGCRGRTTRCMRPSWDDPHKCNRSRCWHRFSPRTQPWSFYNLIYSSLLLKANVSILYFI